MSFKTEVQFLAVFLLFSVTPAQAGQQSIWNEAFPEGIANDSGMVQGSLSGVEISAGTMVSKFGQDIQKSKLLEEEKLLRLEAEYAAADSLAIHNPELKKEFSQIAFAKRHEHVQQMRYRGILEYEAPVYSHQQEEKYLKAKSMISDEADRILKNAVAGREVPERVALQAKALQNRKILSGTNLAVGLALIADGALRLGAVMTNSNPGYLPAVTLTHTTLKHIEHRPAQAENAGAETSMSSN